MSSRSVLIRWGYVTSQVMRDLTIRSDPAFGAFQILKLFLDDWISVNVLRSVALSTNSVAASVEPTIQQQFFNLSPSPMNGHADFNGLDVRGHPPLMAHTPTTSSMLAALQQDSFPSGPLDGPSGFGTDYGSLPYMDTSTPQDDTAPSSALSFGDFTNTNNTYDVTSFTPQDLQMSSTGTPGTEADNESDPVKTEQQPGL
jgi:regulatory factor X